MTQIIKNLLAVIALTFAFTFLFYRSATGLNLLIFNALVMLYYVFGFGQIKHNKHTIVLFAGTLVSAVFVVINNSLLSIWVNIISLFLLASAVVFYESKSLLLLLGNAITNALYLAYSNFFRYLAKLFTKSPKLLKLFRVLRNISIPILIILIFVWIYYAANPLFANQLSGIASLISHFFIVVYRHLNIYLMLVIALGLIVSVYLIFSTKEESIVTRNNNGCDELKRKRIKHFSSFKTIDLRKEYKSTVFLLFGLNALLAYINIIDIQWVWFGFEWNGNYLKQFVHEGTYLLIFSILISITIVLYSFRANINFLNNNRLLKYLAYIWLAQNIILTLSVAIRNYRYVEHFALAYKRIGVFFFLILTIYGIYTVIIKIKDKKTGFYLFRKNTMAVYLILVFMALFNWDVIIARYNMNNYQQSFVHFEFLKKLSYKTLPYTDLTASELNEIEKVQSNLFDFRDKYMSAAEFREAINNRKVRFKNQWENKSWKSWNWAEQKAYNKLFAE